MKTKKSIVHAIAGCEICGKEWQHQNTALKLAREHAKRLKHNVWVELGISIQYDNLPGYE